LQKDLKSLRDLGTLASTLMPIESLQEQAYLTLRRWLCDPSRVGARTAAGFSAAVEKAKGDLRGLVPRLGDLLREILSLRQSLLVHPTPYGGLGPDLKALLPADFVQVTPYGQVPQLPRYLKAMKVRADRWKQNPIKDRERATQLAPFVAALAGVRDRPGGESYRWLVEELRVSLFAQELGTAEPVSPVKLERILVELRAGTKPVTASTPPAPAQTPIVIAPVVAADKKSGPVKSLGALDSLFRR
jgi:ATP-dependent helicase HrpA